MRYSDKELNYEAIVKLAVVIPSLFRDEAYLRVCKKAVLSLDPKADEVITFRNSGEAGLGYVRSFLFDKLLVLDAMLPFKLVQIF